MRQKTLDLNRTKTICLSVALLTLIVTTTLVAVSLSIIQVNAQTLQEKCSPDSGVNISKSNCFSELPTTMGDNITSNETMTQ